MAVALLQRGSGFRTRDSRGEHDDGDRSAIAAVFQGSGSGFVIRTCGLFHDASRTVHELFVLRPHIYHEISVDVAEARHGSGGDHVEDHLVGRAGFHA